jgi:hypothetical protein
VLISDDRRGTELGKRRFWPRTGITQAVQKGVKHTRFRVGKLCAPDAEYLLTISKPYLDVALRWGFSLSGPPNVVRDRLSIGGGISVFRDCTG